MYDDDAIDSEVQWGWSPYCGLETPRFPQPLEAGDPQGTRDGRAAGTVPSADRE